MTALGFVPTAYVFLRRNKENLASWTHLAMGFSDAEYTFTDSQNSVLKLVQKQLLFLSKIFIHIICCHKNTFCQSQPF